MNHKELKQLLLDEIERQNGKTPLRLTIEDKQYNLSGMNRVGRATLYRYTKNHIQINGEVKVDEKQIMISGV